MATESSILLEKGLLPLIGTFVGAILAFLAQRYHARHDAHQKKCDSLVATYRTATANLSTLLTFKACFLSEFTENFESLKNFCLEYVNPLPKEQHNELREQWKSGFCYLFKELAQGTTEPILLRDRWERPIILILSETELYFVAKDRPSILSIISMLRSAEKMLSDALDKRETHTLSLDKFFYETAAVTEGDLNFIKNLTLLMVETSTIIDAVNRSIILNFGLLCLIENYYYHYHGKINFKRARFSDRHLKIFPDIKNWIDFCGNEEDKYIIRQRLAYSYNTINGHRELNHPTGYVPKGL